MLEALSLAVVVAAIAAMAALRRVGGGAPRGAAPRSGDPLRAPGASLALGFLLGRLTSRRRGDDGAGHDEDPSP